MSSKCFSPERNLPGAQLKFNDKKVNIEMREWLSKAVNDFGEIGLTEVATPAKINLKIIDPRSPMTDEERRKKFHSTAMLIVCVA